MIMRRDLLPPIFLSLIIHALILAGMTANIDFSKTFKEESPHRFKIRSVGVEDSKFKNLVFVPTKPSPPQQKPAPQTNPQKKLSFQDMAIPYDAVSTSQAAVTKTQVKTIKELSFNEKQLKQMVQSSPINEIPPRVQRAFQDSDVSIKLDVPKGIPEDELNKHEMVFYSFQKRVAIAYVNSFFSELTDFENSHPHLNFPMVKEMVQVAGKITYDRNGDILKIDTLKWSDVDKLQSFFMDVLKNMSALPNPPKEILQDDTFSINFVLTLNN